MHAWRRAGVMAAAAVVGVAASVCAAEQPTGALLFHATNPCRIADTRAAGGAIASSETRTIALWGQCAVPTGTRAVYLNVTATGASAAGALRVWGDASDEPATSSVAFGANATIAAGALVNVDGGSMLVKPVSLPSGGTVHVLVDVTGYFDEAMGGSYHAVVPCRLIDTAREGQGPALIDGEVRRVAATGACQIPEDAVALAAVVSVREASGSGHLEIRRAGASASGTSTINFTTSTGAGAIRVNGAIVALGVGGFDVRPNISSGGTVQMAIDVAGYYR